MERRKPGVDVILDVLQAAHAAFPASPFISSLLQQYQERGFLTRKQLEGLYAKARKVYDLPPGKLATLDAIILKMPIRYKSEKPAEVAPVYEKNIPIRAVIGAILEKYPEHKRVLYFKAKYDTNSPLTPVEIAELEKFYKLLVKPEER